MKFHIYNKKYLIYVVLNMDENMARQRIRQILEGKIAMGAGRKRSSGSKSSRSKRSSSKRGGVALSRSRSRSKRGGEMEDLAEALGSAWYKQPIRHSRAAKKGWVKRKAGSKRKSIKRGSGAVRSNPWLKFLSKYRKQYGRQYDDQKRLVSDAAKEYRKISGSGVMVGGRKKYGSKRSGSKRGGVLVGGAAS